MLLDRSAAGDAAAAQELVPLIYDELHAIARRQMRVERAGHTLQPTALVHEAYVRLLGTEKGGFANRAHFFAAAAQAVRRILVEHARSRRRLRAGGDRGRAADVDVGLLPADPMDQRVLAVDEALQRLAEERPQQARLVELRFFGGLTTEEAAVALGVAPRTAARDWLVTKAWLARALRPEVDQDG